ncbi:MAG TPA: hypothetical protein VHT04_00245, partial [Stellaceae bacterium]|nr:hypothetical protein [Stellaceae bacterium]
YHFSEPFVRRPVEWFPYSILYRYYSVSTNTARMIANSPFRRISARFQYRGPGLSPIPRKYRSFLTKLSTFSASLLGTGGCCRG